MNSKTLEQLLYEEEGTTLDFKRDQYPFSKVSDEEKSELLKDILGFANAWRRTEAYILIGIQEVQGGKSIVYGISDHLADHALQQFVNNLTNRPLQFGYEAFEYEGKQIGMIRIDIQKRPIFLKKDFGKLRRGEVYVRRGSSTDPSKPADPDEIALMGTGTFSPTNETSLSVEFADPNTETALGMEIDWNAENCEMPESDDIPKLTYKPSVIQLPNGKSRTIPSKGSYGITERLNEDYYHELANFEFARRLFKPIRIVVTNTSTNPATDVRLEVAVNKGVGLAFFDSSDRPEIPDRREQPFSVNVIGKNKPLHALRMPGHVDIESNEQQMKMVINCGSLQPGRKVWTEAFDLAIARSGNYEIKGYVFAANLPAPVEFCLKIDATIDNMSLSLDELIGLGSEDDDEEDDDEEDDD